MLSTFGCDKLSHVGGPVVVKKIYILMIVTFGMSFEIYCFACECKTIILIKSSKSRILSLKMSNYAKIKFKNVKLSLKMSSVSIAPRSNTR